MRDAELHILVYILLTLCYTVTGPECFKLREYIRSGQKGYTYATLSISFAFGSSHVCGTGVNGPKMAISITLSNGRGDHGCFIFKSKRLL